jgi:hypothetical protein
MPVLNLRFVHDHVRAKHYRLTRHATIVRLERGITIAELEQALLNGEIIEQYPDISLIRPVWCWVG